MNFFFEVGLDTLPLHQPALTGDTETGSVYIASGLTVVSLPTYIKAFTRLRRAPTNGGAPHKPILLQLVAQGGIERGK